MTASLPMYDMPATAAANDRLWAGIRDALGEGPASLDRSTNLRSLWTDPDLLLSQTCGLPFRTELHDRVTLVGTPDYGLPGCPAGYYCSVILVRQDDSRNRLVEFAGARVARNGSDSQSGWAALLAHLAEGGTLEASGLTVIDTGSHTRSADAVLDGRADLAALDAVTWTLLQRDNPLLQGLRVLARTRPTPGLPLITSRHRAPEPLFDAVAAAIAALAPRDRATLSLRGIVRIPAERYFLENRPAGAEKRAG